MMKKLLTFAFILCLALCATSAMAAGKLTTTQENIRVYKSYNSFYVYFTAEVTNIGNKPTCYNDGLLELFDANGDVLESSTSFKCYPEYLNPGETGYLWTTVTLKNVTEVTDVDDFAFTVTGKSVNANPVHRFATTARYNSYSSGWYTYEYVYTTIANDTGDTVYDYRVVIVLKDSQGKVLWCGSQDEGSVGMLANTSIELRSSLHYESALSDLKDKGYQISDLTLETIAYYTQK